MYRLEISNDIIMSIVSTLNSQTRVMQKQLDLFFEAMQAYFSGNEVRSYVDEIITTNNEIYH